MIIANVCAPVPALSTNSFKPPDNSVRQVIFLISLMRKLRSRGVNNWAKAIRPVIQTQQSGSLVCALILHYPTSQISGEELCFPLGWFNCCHKVHKAGDPCVLQRKTSACLSCALTQAGCSPPSWPPMSWPSRSRAWPWCYSSPSQRTAGAWSLAISTWPGKALLAGLSLQRLRSSSPTKLRMACLPAHTWHERCHQTLLRINNSKSLWKEHSFMRTSRTDTCLNLVPWMDLLLLSSFHLGWCRQQLFQSQIRELTLK